MSEQRKPQIRVFRHGAYDELGTKENAYWRASVLSASFNGEFDWAKFRRLQDELWTVGRDDRQA